MHAQDTRLDAILNVRLSQRTSTFIASIQNLGDYYRDMRGCVVLTCHLLSIPSAEQLTDAQGSCGEDYLGLMSEASPIYLNPIYVCNLTATSLRTWPQSPDLWKLSSITTRTKYGELSKKSAFHRSSAPPNLPSPECECKHVWGRNAPLTPREKKNSWLGSALQSINSNSVAYGPCDPLNLGFTTTFY